MDPAVRIAMVMSLALGGEAPEPRPAPPVCECSAQCECGCNEGAPCRCARGAPAVSVSWNNPVSSTYTASVPWTATPPTSALFRRPAPAPAQPRQSAPALRQGNYIQPSRPAQYRYPALHARPQIAQPAVRSAPARCGPGG